MKRTLLVLCLATVVSSLFAQTQATLRDIKGKVEVKQFGKNWSPAQEGMVVDALATISTGFDSQATLAIAENRIAVAPLTRLTVDKIIEQAGKSGTSLHLRVGKVSAEVKSSKGTPQDFKVTSPYSTASVRGTEFSYDGMVLEVGEGNVAFIPGKPKRDIAVPAAFVRKRTAEQLSEAVGVAEGAGEQVQTAETGEGAGETALAETGAGAEGSGEAAEAPAEGLVQTGPAVEEAPDVAEFMVLMQAENPDDSFETSDESGAAIVQAPAPGAPGPAAAAPAAPAPIMIAAGSVAVVSIDYSAAAAPAAGGKSSPATQVATGIAGTVSTAAGGALNVGQNKIEAPVYVAPAAKPTTGKIKLRWTEAQ